MKLVQYLDKEREHYGILATDKVVSLPVLAEHFNERFPELLEDFIASGFESAEAARKLLENFRKNNVKSASSSLSEVTFLAPVRSPPKIVCLGLNYRDHAAEQNVAVPDEPIIFMKPRTAIIGPNDNIVKPSFVRKLDYEAELAIVIGRKGKNIPIAEAESHIFGYTILNDVSARDIQFKDKQWTRGKSLDTFAPIGPSITTVDQLGNARDLSIRTWVNDELRQDSTTKNMVFDVCEIIHHLSRVMTLEPCDVIATGTPAGVGFAQKPKPRFLQGGDIVRIEIERIGKLENTVIEEGLRSS